MKMKAKNRGRRVKTVDKLFPFTMILGLLAIGFIAGHDYKASEVCKENGGKFNWDYGRCER